MKVHNHSIYAIKRMAIISFILVLSSIAQASETQSTPWVHIKEGLAIYLGLVPAEMLEGHTARAMHGGMPTGAYRYHIAIALFDDETGKRINDANIQVRFNNRVGVGPDTFKVLETMEMGGKIMYGNYFVPKTTGPYRIDVKILLEKGKKPIEVTFHYDVAHT